MAVHILVNFWLFHYGEKTNLRVNFLLFCFKIWPAKIGEFSLILFSRRWSLVLPIVFPILVLAAAVAQSPTAQPHPTACPKLVAGKPISATKFPMRPGWVTGGVAPEEALQVAPDSPEDVAFHVSRENREFLADGFEFGRETLILSAAGEYRIEILPAGEPSMNTHLAVHVSLNPLPLRAATTAVFT
jgi:hypothetical protein